MTLTERQRKGVEVRLARKTALDELRHAAGKAEALALCAQLLIAAEPSVAGIEVGHVLLACRRVGRVWAGDLMVRAGVNPFKLVGDLFPRELEALVGVLRPVAA